MSAVVQKLLVVGGNGFVGSFVCKVALARGWDVTSISSSGKPYTTPKGHSPAWTSKVKWMKADALNPSTYQDLLPDATSVVHTLGTLLEDTRYKQNLRGGNPLEVLGSVARATLNRIPGSQNPLKDGRDGSYARLNRDAALRVFETFLSSEPSTSINLPAGFQRPFVYLSAEDIFRPFIPTGYIETKREAEYQIGQTVSDNSSYRAVFIRPSLIYHAHLRPLSTLPATILDLSSTLHSKIPSSIPTPASILNSIGLSLSQGHPLDVSKSSSLLSVSCALSIPPIHVEHVAQAICSAVENPNVNGVVGVRRMRELIGWKDSSSTNSNSAIFTTQ